MALKRGRQNVTDEAELKFRAALAEESDFPLTDALYDYITSHAETRCYAKGEAIVSEGDLDPDIYIVKEGIIRGYMTHQENETNICFGMEGTVLASMQGFSLGQPSIIKFEACCKMTMLRIAKSDYDRMMDESHEFCRWMSGVFSRRCCYDELKDKVMNGDARWRYEWLERCRPELFDNVPLKAIASYLKMTEVHVSRIRKSILKGKKS